MQQGNGLQSPLRPLSVLFFHLLLAHLCSGQSQLIAPSQPIVATVGDDIILPCHLEPEADVVAMTLEWTRPDLNDIFVHVRRASQDIVRVQHPSFTGRTSVSIDELKHGNVSLKLSKVKPSDAGRYQCYIPKPDTGSVVELIVGAASSLVISLSEIIRNKGAVVLQCKSTGWYPEPEVFWLDGEGNLLSAGPTETVRGPDDLYTVSSRVTVEKRHSNSFTCRVQQNKANQTRETHIHVPDDFFEVQSSSSSTTVILSFTVAVCIRVILILGFYVWRLKKTKTKRIHRDETGEGEMNQEGEGLVTKSKWPIVSRQKLKEEQQRREEAEYRVQILEEKLQKKNRELDRSQADPVQSDPGQSPSPHPNISRPKFQEEQQRREQAEKKVQILEEELQKKTRELHDEQQRRENTEQALQKKKKELQDMTEELEGNQAETNRKLLQDRGERRLSQKKIESKDKELEKKQAEVQQLQEEIQKMDSNLQTLMEDLDSGNIKLVKCQAPPVQPSSPLIKWPLVLRQKFQEELQKREEAEKKVKILEKNLQTKTRELEEIKQAADRQSEKTNGSDGGSPSPGQQNEERERLRDRSVPAGLVRTQPQNLQLC
ncbi:butyrophilin subfamily 2 member A1-like isoform 1-T1 [Acanthopagrus schlegelii]